MLKVKLRAPIKEIHGTICRKIDHALRSNQHSTYLAYNNIMEYLYGSEVYSYIYNEIWDKVQCHTFIHEKIAPFLIVSTPIEYSLQYSSHSDRTFNEIESFKLPSDVIYPPRYDPSAVKYATLFIGIHYDDGEIGTKYECKIVFGNQNSYNQIIYNYGFTPPNILEFRNTIESITSAKVYLDPTRLTKHKVKLNASDKKLF